ncbi:MAG: GNAT family N-acetyltransferase [Acidimicrobiia bacterium]
MTTRERLESIWPQFGLRITGDGIDLRIPDDDDLVALAELAVGGVHDPGFMPFSVPWTRAEPLALERGVLAHGWAMRQNMTASKWVLPFVVLHEGTIAGVQDIRADEFSIRRTVSTGSWLGIEFHGKGIGTKMRTAVLQLAFEGLDAQWAESGSRIGNPSSARVSEKVGYRADGLQIQAIGGEQAVMERWRMTADQWFERVGERPRFEVTGVEACRPLLIGTPQTSSLE